MLADEIAKLTFDSKKIKDLRKSRRQLNAGFESRWTRSESDTESRSSSDVRQTSESENDSRSLGKTEGQYGKDRQTTGRGTTSNKGRSESSSNSSGRTTGRSESLVPVFENFEEVSNIDYYSFEEQSLEWGKRLRSLKTGEAILQIPNQGGVQPVKVDYFELENTHESEAKIRELVEKNFESEFFMSMDEAKQRHERSLQDLLAGKLRTIPSKLLEPPKELSDDSDAGPFAL